MLALSDAERREIETAVGAAESRTAARFAVVIARASDDYPAYPMLWAALIALIIGNIVALASPALTTWWIVALQAVLFVAADVLLHNQRLRYRLVPPRVKKTHAQKLARLEFAALVHDRTPGDVGLMLFVAEAERHVEILADRGINERVDQAAWDKIIADFVAGFRAGREVEALVSAIKACAIILERHFPATQTAPPPAPSKITEL